MSVVVDKINTLKQQLANISATHILSLPPETPESAPSIFLTELQTSISILSAPVHTTPSLSQIARLILEVNQAKLAEPECITSSPYAKDLEWLFLARCTVDLYGALLDQLFQQTLPLAQDIFYWDDVLSHPAWRLFFLFQSRPPRSR